MIYQGKIILASSSPRRRTIFEMIGINFEVIRPNCDETFNSNLSIEDNVKNVSLLKAESVDVFNVPIIGVDTIVVLDNKILGKPSNREEAILYLKMLSGKKHTVYSGISLIWRDKEITLSDYDKTDVYFRKLTDDDIEWYISTNEWTDKAGGYAIQGVGALLVKRIEGDFYNVMGFPINPFLRIMKKIEKIVERNICRKKWCL